MNSYQLPSFSITPKIALWIVILSLSLNTNLSAQIQDGFKTLPWEIIADSFKSSQKIQYFTQKKEAFVGAEDWANAARADLHLSFHFKSISKKEARTVSAQSAVQQIDKIKTGVSYLRGTAYKELGDALLSRRQYDSSLVKLTIAKNLFSERKSWDTLAECHVGIAVNYFRKKQYPLMEKNLQQVEKILNKHSNKENPLYGLVFSLYGILYRINGDYDKALETLQKGLTRTTDTTQKVGRILNLGVAYKDKGDFERAIDNYLTALNLLASTSNPDPKLLYQTYNNLATAYYRQDNYSEMIDFLKKSLQITYQHPHILPDDELIIMYNNIVIAYIELDSFQQAEQYLNKIQDIQPHGHIQQARTYHNLSYLYRKQGLDEKAVFYLEKAIGENETLYAERHTEIAKEYRHLGIISSRQAQPEKSLQYYQKAIGILVTGFSDSSIQSNPELVGISSKTELLRCLRAKGTALIQLADQDDEQSQLYQEAALASFQSASSLLDSMRNEYREGSKAFWNEEVRPLYEKAVGVAISLYQLTGQQNYLNQAFRFAEKSKAALLADAIQRSAAQKTVGIPVEILELEKSLKIDMAFYKKQIFKEELKGENAKEDKILLWKNKIANSRFVFDSLVIALEQVYPAYHSLKYKDNIASIEQVQNQLAPNELLIEYMVGEKAIFLFGIGREAIQIKSVPIPSDFLATFDSFIDNLRDKDLINEKGRSLSIYQSFTDRSSYLFDLLVGPIWDKTTQHLIVIPDGLLGYLPFEILLTTPTESPDKVAYSTLPYLFTDVGIRYEYSASLLVKDTPQNKTSLSFAGFAPSYGDGLAESRDITMNCEGPEGQQFAKLNTNDTEVNSIAELFHGAAHIGSDAKESTFKQTASQAGILHFAMHGFLNDCDPMYSGLAFENQEGQDDGFLFAYEIYNLKLQANLAVLSACNTGMGTLTKGEGIMSLARAFKYAGCPNIVMSLWQADDEATAQIMHSFYENLDQNMGKDQALRQAKLKYLTSTKHLHPFYWAAFVLIGDNEKIASDNNKMLFIWGFILLLILGGGLWVRRQYS